MINLFAKLFVTISCCVTIVYYGLSNNHLVVDCQRSLFHRKKDLEYRLDSYMNQLNVINEILTTSIYPTTRQALPTFNARVKSSGNVRFSDLIIPTGSLILESHVAKPTIKLLVNKTKSYVNSKMQELYHVQDQLDTIKGQLENQANRFIYKGLPASSSSSKQQAKTLYNFTSTIPGTWLFKQVNYGHVIDSRQINLKQINFTNVDHVINETYMENPKFGLRDSQSRLFFEGRKTFWNTVFQKKLKSGCCDRLKPLHTNRMMTRTNQQEILAPVMFRSSSNNYNYNYYNYSSSSYNNIAAVSIRHLETNNLHNRAINLIDTNNGPTMVSLSVPENSIQLNNLIHIRDPNQPEILKTIVFRDVVTIDDVSLAYSYGDNRLVIGFASNPELKFDLPHDNYLLKYSATRNNLTTMQQVSGRLVIQGSSHFVEALDTDQVNMVQNFNSFIRSNIVRTDSQAHSLIRGPIRFDALPSLSLPGSAAGIGGGRALLAMQVNNFLQVDLLNGMRIPQDIVLLPPVRGSIYPGQQIVVKGSRQFKNKLVIYGDVNVNQLVNGLRLPQDVIPLHLHDSIGSLGYTNLAFVDGIFARQITIQGGKFEDIVLRDSYGDAQSLIMRSVFSPQPDGSQLIRAPLRIMNLKVFGQTPDTGLLNGFRPEHLIELSSGGGNRYANENIYGKKVFLAPIEVGECIFSDINHLSNWTNHLIRIDRPGTVQTIHNRLAFIQQPVFVSPPQPLQQQNSTTMQQQQQVMFQPSSVQINRITIEFLANNDPAHYLSNLNFSPEFHILQQALYRELNNNTGGRYRVLDQVKLFNGGRINRIDVNDVITLDEPFRFADKFFMIGKVEVRSESLDANRIISSYPLDALDLVQFDTFRIPILGAGGSIKLNNLVLSTNNQASFVRCKFLNGMAFTEFANSIMSLTRPQLVESQLVFQSPVNLEGFVRTESSLNGIKNFKQFANNLKNAKYSFENGLQCNSIMIKV